MGKFIRPKLGYHWYLLEPAVLFSVAFLIAWALLGRPTISNVTISAHWFEAGSTLVATFAGAMAAFLLESWREKQRQRARNLDSGRVAFFKLARMANTLANIELNYVREHRADPARAITIPAVLQLDPNDPVLDTESLSFMIANDPNLLGEITIGRARYTSVILLLNERSRFQKDVIQAALKRAGVAQEFEMSREALDKLLGFGNLQEIENLTDQLIDSLDALVPDMQTVANKLGRYLERNFSAGHSIAIGETPPPNV